MTNARTVLRLGGLVWLIATVPALTTARAQELVVTRDGRVLRNARVEHVDPDGIAYRHNLGDTKVAFEDLSENIRRAYGYDPKKAADFRRQQQEQAEAERRLVAESEARHREALAKRAAELANAAAAVAANKDGFTYAPGAQGDPAGEVARRAAASVAAQAEQWERVRARLNDNSLLGNPLWEKSPVGSVVNILDRRIGEIGNGEDAFFTPNYEKRQFADLYQYPPPSQSPTGR